MKRIKNSLLILFFIFLFVPFITVKAADCSNVQHEVNKLEELEANYKELDCDNAEDNSKLSECNMIKVSKSASLEKIFKYNDEKTCPSIDLSRIISEYSGVCSNEFSSTIKDIADKVMNLFFVSAPFLLIILGSLDFFKIVTNGSPDEIKKSRSNFIKRVAAFLLLYLAPLVVKTLFSITPYDMNGTSYICAEIIDLNPKISSTGVKGIYGGYKGSSIGSGSGQAVAEAAAEIKDYIKENEYYYGFAKINDTDGIPADILATDAQTNKVFCCATLIRAALYRGGVYTVEETEAIHINSEAAGAVVQGLYNAGWEVIWDSDDLQPGDVIAYHTPDSSHYSTYIENKLYHVGHVEIYYGDGQKVNTGDGCTYGNEGCPLTGGGFASKGTITYFDPTPGAPGFQGFLCGLRYTGK